MHRKHFFLPATGAPAGDYELYLLGLDWLPEAIQPCCASGECGSSAPFVTRTTAERLVLHGLWPRYDPHRAVAGSAGARGAAWPEYCARSGADFTACCGEQAGSRDRRVSAVCERAAASGRPPPARCALPRAVADAFNTSGRWQAYAPEYAHSRLASHQWAKHGSCTRWTAAGYFAESEKVHGRLAAGAGARLVAASAGANVSYAALDAALARDTGEAGSYAVGCRACRLTEIWFALSAAGAALAPGRFRPNPMRFSRRRGCKFCAAVAVPRWRGCGS